MDVGALQLPHELGSICPSLSPTRPETERYGTNPPGLSEPKIVEISELRATRTEERIKAVILMREHLPNVGQTGWCTFVQSDIVIWLANCLLELFGAVQTKESVLGLWHVITVGLLELLRYGHISCRTVAE